jgi:hypothetical protein
MAAHATAWEACAMQATARWDARLLLCAALALSAGCAGRVLAPELSMGPYRDAPGPLFERTLSGVQTLGYTPTSVDAAHGTIVVPAAFTSRRHGSAEFRVQLYREGWIAVTMTGGLVRRDGRGALTFGELANEYRAFALGLREHVEQRPRGSLGR